MATRVSTGQWLPGKKWPPQAGSAPGQQGTEASESSNHNQGRGEDSVREEVAGDSSERSCLLAGGDERRQSSHRGGAGTGKVSAGLPCSPARSLASAGRAPAWLRPPGKPGAKRLRRPETPGQLLALPFTKGCPPRGMAPRCWLQRGLGGRSPASGAGALGPGEAAHLAVSGARLVHEGAVFTGPHGGRGRMRGAPNGSVLVEARKLHPDSACRVGREAVRLFLQRADVTHLSSTSPPLGVQVDLKPVVRADAA